MTVNSKKDITLVLIHTFSLIKEIRTYMDFCRLMTAMQIKLPRSLYSQQWPQLTNSAIQLSDPSCSRESFPSKVFPTESFESLLELWQVCREELLISCFIIKRFLSSKISFLDFFPSPITVLYLSSNEISAFFSFHLLGDLIDSDETLSTLQFGDAEDDETKELSFFWCRWCFSSKSGEALFSVAIARKTSDLMTPNSKPTSFSFGVVGLSTSFTCICANEIKKGLIEYYWAQNKKMLR